MRLASFQIKNFKSVQDTGVCHFSEDDNILVLAGQNEAGKSAIIEALNFFRNGPSNDFEKLHRRREEDPEVICEFILADDDIRDIFEVTENANLSRYFKINNKIKLVRCISDENTFNEIYFTYEMQKELELFFDEEDESDASDDPAISKHSPDAAETQGETQIENHVATGEESTVTNTQIKDETVENLEVESLTELLNYFLTKIRQYVFYDSFDDLLPSTVTIGDISNYAAVRDFQQVFGVDFADIVQKDDRGIHREEIHISDQASDDLNKYWTQQIEKDSKYNYRVKIIRREPIEQSTVEFMIDRGDGDPLYLEQKSKGFRWFSSFNLRLRALGIEESTINNLVILIDEPGQGLHEKAQKDLKNVIEELGEKDAQIIYATHYPNLIGTVGKEFSRIRLISNTTELGTKAETVAQFASRADVGATDALSPLITAMGIHSVGTLLDSNRLNVLVEGISDHYYLSAFGKILARSDRLFFIPACGVNNIPNLASVLIGWGFDYKAVFDDDPKSGRKAYNLLKKEFYEDDDLLAHEHIFKVKDCEGIEDIFSPKDFHKLVLKIKLSLGKVSKNSELSKGKKELLARLFLERTENNEIKIDGITKRKAQEIFDWLYEKFEIS